MRLIGLIIFVWVLLFPNLAYCEELTIPIPDLEQNKMTGFEIGLKNNGPVTDLAKPSKEEKADRDSTAINVSSTLTELPVKNYWNSYLSQSHEYRGRTNYHGFESVINDQIRRVAMRFYNQYSDQYFDGIYQRYHYTEYNTRMERLALESMDFDYRWWDRSFLDSIVPEKGGAIIYTRNIGNDHEMFRIGTLGIDNTGKFSLNNYSIDVSTNTDLKNKKKSDYWSETKNLTSTDDADLSKRRLLFGIRLPLSQLLRTNDYVITGNAKINLRVDQFDMQNKSGVSGYVRFTALHKRNPWLDVQLKGTARPLVNEYAAEFSIQLVGF